MIEGRTPGPVLDPDSSGHTYRMPETLHLGNDIVALTSPRCRGKVEDVRFLQRVFAPEERDAILSSTNPETTLWLFWAGKEALFKSASKALGAPPIFNHSSFHIAFGPHDLPHPHSPSFLQGHGTYRDITVQLEGEIRRESIHVLSWLSDPRTPFEKRASLHSESVQEIEEPGISEEDLRARFSQTEWNCISHRRSALTRLRARASLASVLDIEEDRVEIRCGPGEAGQRIPLVFVDGGECPVDLTLSHDGDLMAWAFCRPE